MLSGKRPFIFAGLLLLALAAFVNSSPQAQSGQTSTSQQPVPPTVSLESNMQVITICADSEGSRAETQVRLRANAVSPEGNPFRYRWIVSGGRIVGDGADVVWDLSDAQPGTYSATVEASTGAIGSGCMAFSSTKVLVRNCPPPRPVCPNVIINCPDTVTIGQPVSFTASVSGGTPGITPVFNWTVSAGTIIGGQGTSAIQVDTTGLGGQQIRATVEVAGYNLTCNASCTTQVPAPIQPRRADEFGEIQRDDEKARLDNFAIALQNEPGATGYVIVYAGRTSRAGYAQRRANFARDYLVNTRGIEASRIVTLDGGFRESVSVELWVVPPGATPPSPYGSGSR
jgi:hypothetical protein